ncbi:MAG: hypothetical protein QME16_02285, partial [Planctomycetota bacterium]|nr:hypothetical protein [Planctomycetota bacterium]
QYQLPMTLDVAHIYDDSLVYKIIQDYSANITTVHLSAIGHEEHHLPIDSRCLKIVELLQGKDWSGNLILEYLPEYQHRLQEDINSLDI